MNYIFSVGNTDKDKDKSEVTCFSVAVKSFLLVCKPVLNCFTRPTSTPELYSFVQLGLRVSPGSKPRSGLGLFQKQVAK